MCPDRIVVGVGIRAAEVMLQAIYRPLRDFPIMTTDLKARR